jgi:nitrogen fixation NifU-like protein
MVETYHDICHRSIPIDAMGIGAARGRMREPVDDLYRDYILEHYRRPHNFGVLDNATTTQEGANPLCGDRITLQLRVADGQIAGVGFTGRGCAISQASTSLLTDEIKGKPVDQAASITSGDVLELLGIEISPARMKCAMLSLETLQGALGPFKGTAAPASEPEARATPA